MHACMGRVGENMLHWYSRTGNHLGITDLLAKGADGMACNVQGETPVHVAAFNGHWRCIVALAEGYNLSREEKLHPLMVKKDKDGWAPMHWAAQQGHVTCVKALILCNADVNQPLAPSSESPPNIHPSFVFCLIFMSVSPT
ncbi:ankyrin repeat-containing domain protein [Baffinella frigidus]|nr:ankyrin repeat-containing domain protein [Cryptophyta sp. CCMP2293]